MISLKIDWFDLLAVQVTLRSLLQHHSSKASILWCSDLFMVQLSQLYVTTGKTIAFTIQIFISRVVPRVFNTLSRFVIAFLPRSSHLISWLYSPSAAQEEEICHYSTFSPAICHEVTGLYRASLVAAAKTLLQCRRPRVGKIPWRRTWHPLQYSCLENRMDRGAWWATLHGLAQPQPQLKRLNSSGNHNGAVWLKCRYNNPRYFSKIFLKRRPSVNTFGSIQRI